MEYKLLFECIVGSTAYGTNTPESDIDKKGVYIQPIEDLITFDYKEQINVNKDETYYEIRRFIQLLQTGNPTVLEMLYSPNDCVLKITPEFQLLIDNRDKFLTKKCFNAFGGYAISNISKAKGLDKKLNWEKDRTIRKTPIDFIYAFDNGKTILLNNYLNKFALSSGKCGLTALDHMKDCYALYYDDLGTLGYRGIIGEESNELRLSAISSHEIPITIIYYNKENYSKHCRDFKDYSDWLKNRNTQRYVDIENHNQMIDGKNLLHTRRLLDQAIEIAELNTINVRRPNADYLISGLVTSLPVLVYRVTC